MDLPQDWVSLLGELDRQVSSGRLSPDTASLPELMSGYDVPGVSIAVGHVSGQVWAAGFGVTAVGTSTPVTASTAFAACSISKHVAAFGALLLVQGGALDLDADIGEYLTSWHLPGRDDQQEVTVRQLLAHTAGLSDTWYPAGHGRQQLRPAVSAPATGSGGAWPPRRRHEDSGRLANAAPSVGVSVTPGRTSVTPASPTCGPTAAPPSRR
ncbi:beta-lactamase family protein [Micromonospora sp. NBC_00362]|uniref:serine hydrolase domain-containing protein n=1 Tax=Micromonospora sp. NBC_00362 TaxID=2975975 RepID=UPI00225BC653|nr:serine hydrolase domain-containing protein [Micromonospora sp. NBC_00362]MCX5117860.1 beta-lactamase family protein [Micromonospora sp. NBC_00362]